MENKQILYGINLNDYWYPKCLRTKKGYVGTKDELETFASLLETFYWSNEQACAVSAAIRGYFSGLSTESMVQKYGDGFEWVHPLEVIYQSEPITLEHHFWQYKTANDAVYPMYADSVSVSRIIVILSLSLSPYIAKWLSAVDLNCITMWSLTLLYITLELKTDVCAWVLTNCSQKAKKEIKE